MHPLRAAVPLALAVGLVAASPAAADSPAKAGRAPVARAAGGDAGPPIYPRLVNTRMVRTQRALDRAVDLADDDQTAKAVSALTKARVQLRLAWRASKHVIETAPPPAPPGDGLGRVRVRVKHASRARARTSGGAVGGSAIADQFTTAGGVLDLQHTVAQTAIGIIDSSHGDLRDGLSRTIFTALNQRDGAIAYIHSIDTPPPPGDGLARAAGGAVGGTWATIMPPIADQANDETNQIEGVQALSDTLASGIKRVLRDAEFQIIKTQRTINQYWPPTPGD
jgi:hypothetical protein